ncbi:MAG: HAMP domain-containing protein [Ardenticatenaceae bacterium]|nr:HAMP domain-containing protein [Ardenticatenaceae bacterium]MCB9444361.1 HAMP domain-containing protein [Ardenticatenaceae bacterium]
MRKFQKVKISQKILIPIILLVIATIGSLIFIGDRSQRSLLENEEQEHLRSLGLSFADRIAAQGQTAVALATNIAEMPAVQQAFAEQDREALIALLHESYLASDAAFGIPQSQFHLPPATSFLRLHNLEKYGDDLSSFRNTVLAANAELRPISGLEKGKGGLGIRGVVPVFYNGEHVGSFEMGMNFDEQFVANFKETYGAETAVYLYEPESKVDTFEEETANSTETDFVLYAATAEEPLVIDEANRLQVLQSGESLVVNVVADDVTYAVLIAPIKDYTGDVVGVVEMAEDRSDLMQVMAASRRSSILAGGVILLVTVATIWWLIRRLIDRPINHLRLLAVTLARGETDFQLEFVERQDEIGDLARAFGESVHYLNERSEVAERLARGELTAVVPIASEKDVLGRAMTSMKQRVSAAIEAIGRIVDAAVAGQLDTRVDVSQFEGDYAQIVSGMNAVLDAVTRPLTIASESLNKFALGELSAKIDGDFAGDYAQIKNSANAVIDMLQMRNQDIQRLLAAAAEGRLNERADVSRYTGANGKVLEGINGILDATAVPMKATSQVLTQVAGGDLTVSMNGGYQGDYAILSNSTKEMIAGLRGMAEQMQEGAVNITSATAQILASSKQMVGVTQEQASAVNQITSTVEEIRASAEQVAQHAQGVADAASEAARAAQRGSDAAEETIDGMDDIRQKVESIAENILSLSEQMQQIGDIIDTVTDIADQSNILALNAAIEAAQAGEAGKGFRVVADEVRSLAEQSRQAAGQVKIILGDIQKATNLAVMATEQGTKGVDAGTAMVNRTAQTIRELAGTVDASAQAAQQIVAGVQQQTVGLDQIAIGMGDINMATQQTAAGAQQSQKATEDLNTLADQLKDIVVQYKL